MENERGDNDNARETQAIRQTEIEVYYWRTLWTADFQGGGWVKVEKINQKIGITVSAVHFQPLKYSQTPRRAISGLWFHLTILDRIFMVNWSGGKVHNKTTAKVFC